jgi:hypothetical protein
MAALPEAVVRAHVESEMPAALAWAARHGLEADGDGEALELRVRMTSSGGEPYLLEGRFDSYRAIAPAWRFLHPDTGEPAGGAAFPHPAPSSPWGTVLLTGGPAGPVICAHFNRLAYGEHNGPHPDWGPVTNWPNVAPGQARADTIAGMVDRIYRDVWLSPHRLAPLP